MRLVVSRLTRSFGPRRIFGPLTFEVETGRVLGIAGPNGAGKTTLVKILAGLLRPSSGSVSLHELHGHYWLDRGPGGEDQGPRSPRDVPLALGWAAPDLALYGDLSAAENLEFFGRVSGFHHEKAWIDERLLDVGLSAARVGSMHVRFFSTGQRQRLKLAFALLNDAPLLLLDEPSSNLDEAGHAVVEAVVEAQRGRGLAVVASNDPRDLALADETVSL